MNSSAFFPPFSFDTSDLFIFFLLEQTTFFRKRALVFSFACRETGFHCFLGSLTQAAQKKN